MPVNIRSESFSLLNGNKCCICVSRVAEFSNSGEEKSLHQVSQPGSVVPGETVMFHLTLGLVSNQKGREAARMLGGCLASSLNSPVV